MLYKFFLLFFTLIIISGCFDDKDREVYIMNEGFKGIVYVLFNQPDGVLKEYDSKGRRIYKIPNSGILKTQFAPNPGGFKKSDRKFFYVDSVGIYTQEFEWFSLFAVHHQLVNETLFKDSKDSIAVYGLSYVSNQGAKDENGIMRAFTYNAYIIDNIFYRNEKKYPSLSEKFLEK